MKKQLPIFSFVITLSLLTNSCIKDGDLDFSNIGIADNFTYDLPIPLVDSRLTLDSLLRNIQGQRVLTGDDGLLKLVYQEEISLGFSDLGFSISNQFFERNLIEIPVPQGDLFPTNTIQFSEAFSLQLGINNGIRVDSVRTQAMDFRFDLFTGIQNQVRFSITSSNIVDASGRGLRIDTLLPGTRGGNQQVSLNLDLSNHTIIPDNSNPYSLHTLQFNYTITVFKDTLITQPYLAFTHLYTFLENIEIDYAYGYFGQQIFGPISDGIDLAIFDRFPMDLLEIDQANMNLAVTNGFGAPVLMDAEISTLTRNPVNPIKSLDLSNKRLDYPRNLLAPPITTSFQEEIQDLINDNSGFLPYRMNYSATITTNPDDNPAVQNFVSKNSFIKMDIGAEIPLKLRVGGLQISDTINFAGLPFTDGIEFFIIKANMHNAFPLDATISLHFLDSDKRIIDSVDIDKIEGGVVDATGHVIRSTVSQITIDLNKSQIENLVNTRYFKINAILNTSDHENHMISIFEDSGTEGFLRVLIGCRIRASGKLIDSFSGLVDGIRPNE